MLVEIVRQIGSYFVSNDLIEREIEYHDEQVRYFREARIRVIRFGIPSEDKHEMIVSDIRSGALHAWCADRLRAEKGMPAKYDRDRILAILKF